MKKETQRPKRKKKQKREYATLVLFAIFFVGLSVLLYPTVSDYYNSFHESRAVAGYETAVAELKTEDFRQYHDAARAYNEKLRSQSPLYYNGDPQEESYKSVLDVSGDGMMGYIEIPPLRIRLPVYHGTGETVLSVGAGHLEGSSLPVGGASTHAVLTGHRGLPSAKLFTNLDKMEVGDVFSLNVLDEILTYQVEQISIVKPVETEPLNIVEGKDYCTLVTCTPYGVNSHRLLIRGTRITTAVPVRVTADASLLDPVFVAPAVAAPILLALLVLLLWQPPKRRESETDAAAALLGAKMLAAGTADGTEERLRMDAVGDTGGVEALRGTDAFEKAGGTDSLFAGDKAEDAVGEANGGAGGADDFFAGNEIEDVGENDASVETEIEDADGAEDDLETLDLSEFPQDSYTED